MLVTVELWRRGRPDTEATAAFAGRRSRCRPSVGRPRRWFCCCGGCFRDLGVAPLNRRRLPFQIGCLFSAGLCQSTFLCLLPGLQTCVLNPYRAEPVAHASSWQHCCGKGRRHPDQNQMVQMVSLDTAWLQPSARTHHALGVHHDWDCNMTTCCHAAT